MRKCEKVSGSVRKCEKVRGSDRGVQVSGDDSVRFRTRDLGGPSASRREDDE